MIGQGLGPGGNFSWWDLNGNNFERKAKAASDAITKRAQEEEKSIWWQLWRDGGESLRWMMGFIYSNIFVFVPTIYARDFPVYFGRSKTKGLGAQHWIMGFVDV